MESTERTWPVVPPTGFSLFVWGVWPFVNWALPPLLIVVYFVSESAGWDGLFLLIFSPLIIPAAALLGSLPRFIMRKRGFTWAPVAVQVMLAVHWWNAFFLILTLRGVGDSGSVKSMLESAYGLSTDAAKTLTLLSLVCIAAAWCAQVIWASAAPAPHTASTRAPRLATALLGGLSFVIVPLLFVGLCLLTQGAVRLANDIELKQPDLSGVASAEAMAITNPDEIRSRQEEAWDAAQEQVSPVRAAISDEHWTLYVYDPNGISYSFIDNTYTVKVAWRLKLEMPTKQLYDEATAATTDDGWKILESRQGNSLSSLTAVNDSGYRLKIEVQQAHEVNDGATLVRLTLVSPEYWIEGEYSDWSGFHDISERDELLGRGEDGSTEQPEFTSDEWPPLSLVMTPWK